MFLCNAQCTCHALHGKQAWERRQRKIWSQVILEAKTYAERNMELQRHDDLCGPAYVQTEERGGSETGAWEAKP